MKELIAIQSTLVAPKGQYNSFGKYKYRSAEDILEAVKPLLKENSCTLTLTDDVVMVGDRIYIQATATLKNAKGESESSMAYAREENEKKGMDSSQVTGAASSYARKYALNGLFAIDDNKDSDATNTHGKSSVPQVMKVDVSEAAAIIKLGNAKDMKELGEIWKSFGDKFGKDSKVWEAAQKISNNLKANKK